MNLKNPNIILILCSILSASVLLVENMIYNLRAYVYIYYLSTPELIIASIITGFALGWGIKGLVFDKKQNTTDDDFNSF